MSELCSLCQVVEAGPYCPEHGVVHQPFSIAGRYQVQELLGAIGELFVFGARDHAKGRWVAIRVERAHLTGEQLARVYEVQQRFLRDNAALDTRVRERAVGIIDFGWDDALGVTYLVACRVDDPMLQPSLAEVEALLRALEAPPEVAEPAPAVLAAGSATELPSMIGSYDVIGALGVGGTGRVYLGQHPVIGSKVAIKVLLPDIARSAETVDRFIQEARASSQIGSPYIPRYFDFGTTQDGLPYAIMEYFEGETLGVRLGRVGTLSIADTAHILSQVASALLMAHEAGLVHRDLKPDNIFLVNPDSKTSKSSPMRASGSASDVKPPIEIKVLDFGIAKVVGNRSPHRTLTGSFLGTPFYCAPEQVFGHDVDARTDVYSLGATAFEMLIGAPPFVGTVPVILSAKATEDPPDLAKLGVPEKVAYTIRRMLAREPRYRAPSMAWVLDQLAHWEVPGEREPTLPDHPAVELPDAPTDRGDVASAPPLGLATGSVEELAPATTSQVLRVVAPRSRTRRWVALALAGGALATGGLVVLLGGSSESSTTSTSPTPGSSTPGSRAGTTAPSAPVSMPPAPVPSATTSAPTAGPSDPVPEGSTPAAQGAERPGGDVRPGKPGDDGAPARGVHRRPGAKPLDRKPPSKKPPASKPPPNPSDVLIVDPFSSTRSDPR